MVFADLFGTGIGYDFQFGNTLLSLNSENISGNEYPIITGYESDGDGTGIIIQNGILLRGTGSATGILSFVNGTGQGGTLQVDNEGNLLIIGSIYTFNGGFITKALNQSVRGDILTIENIKKPTSIGQETNILFEGKTEGGLIGREQIWGRIGFNQTDITEYAGQAYFYIEVNGTKLLKYDWNSPRINFFKSINSSGDINSSSRICDGFGNCLDSVNTYNTTQEMITAVNTTGYLINWSNVISGNEYFNSSPITLDSYTFGLMPCPNTYVLTYNTTYSGWQCQPKDSTGGGTVTSVSGDGKYVLGTITNAGSFTFNETKLNETIDNRAIIGGGNSTQEIINAVNGSALNLSNSFGYAIEIEHTSFLGSSFSGNDGDTNRNITINAEMVVIDNFNLHPESDFNVSNGVLIVYVPIYDTQRITVYTNTNNQYLNYFGSSCSGSDGDDNRILTTSYNEMVIVDNQMLHKNYDYTSNSTDITFSVPIYDTQRITVWG
jgi:hypothetical protein